MHFSSLSQLTMSNREQQTGVVANSLTTDAHDSAQVVSIDSSTSNSKFSPHITTSSKSLRPQDVLQLQRTIGNRAVQRLITSRNSNKFPVPCPLKTTFALQRTFDLDTVKDVLLKNVVSVTPLKGGTTNKDDKGKDKTVAYHIRVSSGDSDVKDLVLKVSGSTDEVLNSQLGELLGINTSRALMLPIDPALIKILGAKNEDLGEELKNRRQILVMDYISSRKEKDNHHIPNFSKNKNKSVDEKYGNIAIFDFLIGKTDLFVDAHPDFSPQNMIKVDGGKDVGEIDLATSGNRMATGPASQMDMKDFLESYHSDENSRQDSVEVMINKLLNPADKVMDFVSANIGSTVDTNY